MKTCIFVVGAKNAGKTTLIRALTGCAKKGALWDSRYKNGQKLKTFVVTSAITELGVKQHGHEPENFPDSLENQFKVSKEEYELLICPFELNTWDRYSLDKYIKTAKSKDFNVKVAVIKINRNDEDYTTNHILDICRDTQVEFIEIDLRKDYNPEANRIINSFYP